VKVELSRSRKETKKRIRRKILVALGGNALIKQGQVGSAAQQEENARKAAKEIVTLLNAGNRLVITHGNGPQVGDLLLKNELAKDKLPTMPLDICGAESQGMLGYILQQAIENEGRKVRSKISTASIISQTMVSAHDRAFENPSKPVGPFYSELESMDLQKSRGWKMVFQAGRGYRRLVPSPRPVSIIETPLIESLFKEEFVVIQSGGGGIPVVRNAKGELVGVEAVIDKDLSAALLASELKMDLLMILTDVEKVALNFGKPDQKGIDRLNLKECREYMNSGQFAKGSMAPKIQAAMNFVKSGGKEVIITSLERAIEALEGKTGTRIVP
jgi:carbamate kinase